MQPNIVILILAAAVMFAVIGGLAMLAHHFTLDGIKSRTVGDGQHGTARWATPQEISKSYAKVPFQPELWRRGEHLPERQGIVVGTQFRHGQYHALVDTDDVHVMMIGAAGVGKTAHFLYPNLEYAFASGMSVFTTDTKGDLYRSYAAIARDCYGYRISVLDLRDPVRSNGNNMLHLVNKYMDLYLADNSNVAAKARAERHAKVIAKTIINTSGGDSSAYGQNAYFYDAAEGLLQAVILLLAEFMPPVQSEDGNVQERRHIVSVFKLVQELMEPSRMKGKTKFQLIMEQLPPDHKAKWLAGAALNTGEQAMASVLSTVMSRLNAFLDTELEQILCFGADVDAEQFAAEKSAIFLVLPEEDNSKYFMASLFIQQLYRELLGVADEHGGKLPRRVVFYCDEVGTMPKIESFEMILSGGRSRRLSVVPIIQSYGQLQRNYGKEGAEIIEDNCQVTVFSAFAPQSDTAKILSEHLGSRTVLSGSVSRGKIDPGQSLQMTGRPLLYPDEIKVLPRGEFVVTKSFCHPMRTTLPLFLKLGIRFDAPFELPDRGFRTVAYASAQDLELCILHAAFDGAREPAEAPPGGTQPAPPAPKGPVVHNRFPSELADIFREGPVNTGDMP